MTLLFALHVNDLNHNVSAVRFDYKSATAPLSSAIFWITPHLKEISVL